MTTVLGHDLMAKNKAARSKRLAGKARQRPLDLAKLPDSLTTGQAAWLANCGHSCIHSAIKKGKIKEVTNLNEGTDLVPIYRINTAAFLEVYGLTHLLPVAKSAKGGV